MAEASNADYSYAVGGFGAKGAESVLIKASARVALSVSESEPMIGSRAPDHGGWSMAGG